MSSGDTSLHDARMRELNEVLDVVRAAVAADGGEVALVDVDTQTGVVRVRLSGACGSCSVAGATLEEGIQRVLRQRLSWVTSVEGEVEQSEITGRGGWRPLHGSH